MRMRVAVVVLLALAAGPGQCGGTAPYDACQGKTCGEACRACPPEDAQCVETAVVMACNPLGRCVPEVPGLCAPPPDACAGKVCGQTCLEEPPCRAATPPCMTPSVLGRCDDAGRCVAGGAVACQPVADCAGQPCGVPCDPCGGMCMHPYASACDGSGACVPGMAGLCPP